MSESLYHPTTPEQAQRRKELAPGVHDAFQSFSKAILRPAGCAAGRPSGS